MCMSLLPLTVVPLKKLEFLVRETKHTRGPGVSNVEGKATRVGAAAGLAADSHKGG